MLQAFVILASTVQYLERSILLLVTSAANLRVRTIKFSSVLLARVGPGHPCFRKAQSVSWPDGVKGALNQVYTVFQKKVHPFAFRNN